MFFFFPLCSCFLGTVPQRWFILKTSERTGENVFQTGRELAGITVQYVMFPKCIMCNRKMPPFSPVQFLLPGEFSTIVCHFRWS